MENRDRLYGDAIAAYGAALQRLAKGYEADPDLKQDLLQQISIAIWRKPSAGCPVLFLIDKILSGTNSPDRRAAADAVEALSLPGARLRPLKARYSARRNHCPRRRKSAPG